MDIRSATADDLRRQVEETMDESEVEEMMQKLLELTRHLSNEIIVERDMVQLLVALAEAHGWNIAEALDRMRAELAQKNGGQLKDEALRQAYLSRMTSLLASAGRKSQ